MTFGDVATVAVRLLVVVAVVAFGAVVVPWLALWCMYGVACLLIL